jgi:hypothetical protein
LFEAFEDLALRQVSPGLARSGTPRLLSRLCYRTANTVAIAVVAFAVPHFSLFIGLIGALSYWPLQVKVQPAIQENLPKKVAKGFHELTPAILLT